MNKHFVLLVALTSLLLAGRGFAAEGSSSPYSDPAGDIDGGISTGGGTLDILGMEVTNNATDITFKLTVNGNINAGTGGVDWGKFMIGIATGGTGTTSGNGWGRPINLTSPAGGMNYWIGSWVDAGGGSQLWSYSGAAWSGPSALAGFTFTAGATSTINYTLSLASLGLAANDTFYFDAYSSGGGGTDTAIDALANPNVSVTSWSQTYTSQTVASSGPGLNSYQVVPEPSTCALLALAGVGVAGYAARRRARR